MLRRFLKRKVHPVIVVMTYAAGLGAWANWLNPGLANSIMKGFIK